ncbi:MAG: ABC transporter ATP-binding protein [Rhodospirillaceae bacterium]|nr:MAG: ABC transporter ATP-binding protein [Rhodospirillaceae bacterium]
MTAMVVVDRLVKTFGNFVAVDGISLTVAKGEVLGFLGPNGAGKTTTMRMIAGFLTPTSGQASVCGHEVANDPIAVKRAMGYMPEGSPSYDDMTVRAFLTFIAAVRGFEGADAQRHIDRAVERVVLDEMIDRPIDVLSKGYKRRVGLAQAILHDPPVLILDEPTDGLDPNQKHHVRSLIKEMASEKAIIISTHILEEVTAVCTRAVIIGNGKLLADGTSDQLLAKLPDYHAVAVVVPVAQVDAAVAAMRGVPNVAYTQSETIDAGTARVRAIPKINAPILSDVASAMRNAGINVAEIFQDRGDLDDVFRLITTGAVKSAA